MMVYRTISHPSMSRHWQRTRRLVAFLIIETIEAEGIFDSGEALSAE